MGEHLGRRPARGVAVLTTDVVETPVPRGGSLIGRTPGMEWRWLTSLLRPEVLCIATLMPA